MGKLDSISARAIFSVIVLIGLLYMPLPVFSQSVSDNQNLILNGGFEGGFQAEHGVGYEWGAFSNGGALVGWQPDSWPKVVVADQYAQMIEIKNAAKQNRYAGIFQTVSVVPGEAYQLSIKGVIRSSEGDIELSDYGYRLQYAIDYNGDTAWELLPAKAWVELPWDEQPLAAAEDTVYRRDSYQTTITARGESLTLFIRGWKKWGDNGTGIFDLDEISLVGPGSGGIKTSTVNVSAETDAPEAAEFAPPAAETAGEADQNSEGISPDSAPAAENSQLPVSGYGSDENVRYLIFSSVILLLVLFIGAIVATMRQRQPVEE